MESPKVLATARGKDTAAAKKCLEKLTPDGRAAVQTHRVDMGKVYGPVCNDLLPGSRMVVDRFHVAKQFNDAVDDLRKKTTRKYKAQLSKAHLNRASQAAGRSIGELRQIAAGLKAVFLAFCT